MKAQKVQILIYVHVAFPDLLCKMQEKKITLEKNNEETPFLHRFISISLLLIRMVDMFVGPQMRDKFPPFQSRFEQLLRS